MRFAMAISRAVEMMRSTIRAPDSISMNEAIDLHAFGFKGWGGKIPMKS